MKLPWLAMSVTYRVRVSVMELHILYCGKSHSKKLLSGTDLINIKQLFVIWTNKKKKTTLLHKPICVGYKCGIWSFFWDSRKLFSLTQQSQFHHHNITSSEGTFLHWHQQVFQSWEWWNTWCRGLHLPELLLETVK